MTRFAKALATVSVIAMPLAAQASPFNDFENQLRDAYGQYRAALVQTSLGNADGTTKAIGQFTQKWTALEDKWMTTPPPQYIDDPQFDDTLTSVATIIGEATQIAQEGNLPGAHESLEGVRDQLGELHLRNGLFTFSDRINAYHAKMETVLSTDYSALGDGAASALTADAAVLEYLAAEIAAHPAPEADAPTYAPLVKGLIDSVAAVTGALDKGDVDAAIKAASALKPPFAKLFAMFG